MAGPHSITTLVRNHKATVRPRVGAFSQRASTNVSTIFKIKVHVGEHYAQKILTFYLKLKSLTLLLQGLHVPTLNFESDQPLVVVSFSLLKRHAVVDGYPGCQHFWYIGLRCLELIYFVPWCNVRSLGNKTQI